MNRVARQALVVFAAGICAGGIMVLPAPVGAQEGASSFLTETRPLLDLRLRYEGVEQEGLPRDAQGLTLRARAGVESGSVAGFRLLVEGDLTRALGVDDFNSTVDGPPDRPVIADPDSERLHRLHLTWAGVEGWSVAVGRQRIIHDDARFVGNVGFRQNEQTFDAVRLQGSPAFSVDMEYGYVWQVNRIFGSHSLVGSERAGTHLLRVRRAVPFGTVGAHAYFIGLNDALVGASNRVIGTRLAGSRDLREGWTVTWAGGYFHQSEHGDNPDVFSLDYWMVEGEMAVGGITGSVGLEVLEGDGSRGFATPLATLHGFQGFTDLFLTTPASGLQDWRAGLSFARPEVPHLGVVEISGGVHRFRSDRSGGVGDPAATRDLGRELNLTVSASPRAGTEVSIKVADHSGGSGVPRTRKLWLTAGFVVR